MDCSETVDTAVNNFHSHKNNFVYFDDENRLYFCKLSPKFSDVKCKSGSFKPEWRFRFFKIIHDIAIVVAESEGVDILFLNYFTEDIFTWFYTKEIKNHPIFVIDTSNSQDYKMLNFSSNGFSVTDLAFHTYMKVNAWEIDQLSSSLVYLEGMPIIELNCTIWDGKSVLNLFQGAPMSVVYSRANRVFFQKLGFSGNNMDFRENSLQKIFYFSLTNVTLKYLPVLTDDEIKNIDNFPQTPQMYYYSNIKGDLIFFFADRIVISKHNVNFQNLHITENNLRQIIFPSEFQLRVDNIIQVESRANEILVLLRYPYQIISVNRKSLEMIYYQMHADFLNKKLSKCKFTNFLIMCHSEMEMVETIVFYKIIEGTLKILREVNIEILKKIFNFKNDRADGRKVSKIMIVNADNDPVRPNTISIILKLEFGGIYETRGFTFTMKTERNKKENINEYKFKNYKIYNRFSEPGMISNNAQVIPLGRSYLVLETDPKYRLFWFDQINQIELEYLDTNQIVHKFISRQHLIIVLVYRSLSDEELYFAVYRLTPNSIDQFIRNQRLAIDTPHLMVDFLAFSPTKISIIFYDIALQRILFTYTFFVNGPFLMGKTHSDIVLNDMRYQLDLHEDKSMHYNRFVHKQSPYMEVNDTMYQIEIPLKDYFEIEGNIDFISVEPLSDPELMKNIIIEEGIHFQSNNMLKKGGENYDSSYKRTFIENKKFFAVNLVNKNSFSVFK